jgi:uncharacterized protein YggE
VSKVAGRIVFCLGLLTLLFSQPALADSAGQSMQVFHGEGEVTYLPDLAKVSFYLMRQAAAAPDAEASVSVALSEVSGALRLAGMPALQDESEPGAEKAVRLKGEGTPRYAAGAYRFVSVRDFTLLAKITTTLTSHGVLDWTVSYVPSDVDALEARAGTAAADDAARQAKIYAQERGLLQAEPVRSSRVYICSYSGDQSKPFCHEMVRSDERLGATEEIVVTARRREGARTDFSVPKPVEQRVTATIAAVFTFK